MKAKVLVTTLIALLIGSLLATPTTASAQKAPKPFVVGTDDPGDWGANADANIALLGGPLGQELLEASISMIDAKTIGFNIKVASLPPQGGWPEVSRYNWDISVGGGDLYQITGGFTEYARGVCNPLHTNYCPPPQDPGMQPFFIRQGPCTVGAECHVVGLVHATFDAATGTITIPVPLETIKAKPGSKIGPGVTTLGGTVYAAPAAVVSHASLPNDVMTVLKSFTVPK